jgi:MoaE-MoaD fusion protein
MTSSAAPRLVAIDYLGLPGRADLQMQVRVLFFGVLRELGGKESDRVSLPQKATVASLLDHYRKSVPGFARLLPSIATSVNREYAAPQTVLKEGDEVALLPPVSGGTASSAFCSLTREKIDSQGMVESLKQPDDGAVVVFEGVVRNNTRGRRTLYLDYEAYEEMALKQMQALTGQALSQFAVRDVAMVHRLGRLEIGEISVLIVVVSAHRGVAFDACRWLIDTLKRTVPIWKKEHFEDGAVWADGEPFPPEISKGQDISGGKPASKLSSPR